MRKEILRKKPLVLLHISLIQLICLSAATAQCLYPNGTANPDPFYQPCSSDASNPLHTICCATGRPNAPGSVGETRDVCMPNGLCQNSNKATANSQVVTSYFRDACTEKDWASGKCLNVCTDNANLANVQLTPCDGTATSDKWCCGNTKDCCTNSPITIPKSFGVNNDVSSSSLKLSASTVYPSSTTASTHPPSSIKTSSTAKSPPAAGAAKPRPGSVNSKSSSLSPGAIAGIVLGVIIGLALMFATGYYIASRRRKVYGTPLPKAHEASEVRYSNPTPRVVSVAPPIRYELPANQKPLELP